MAVVAILIIVVTSSSFVALKVGSRQPAVRRAVLSRILPKLDAELTIGELEIGLASIAVRDIDLDLGSRGSVRIPSATIALSYRKLLLNGLDARHALSTVIVSGPVVTLRYGLEESEKRPAPSLLDLGQYLPDYLGVSDATLVLEDERTGRAVTVGSIDLLMEREAEGRHVRGSATATLLGDGSNLSVETDWDTPGEVLTVDAELHGARLTGDVPFPQDIPLTPAAGVVDATLAATLRSDAPLALSVTFALDDGKIVLPGELGSAVDVAASGVYDVAGLSFTLARAVWDGATLTGRADIDLERRSFDAVSFSVRDLEAVRAVELAGISSPVSAVVAVEGSLHGPWASPAVDASVSARSALLGDVAVEDVAVEASYSEERLEVASLTFGVFGGNARFSGNASRGEASGEWTLAGSGDATGLDASLAADAVGLTGWAGGLSMTGLEARVGPGLLEVESLLSWSDATAGPVLVGSGAGGFMLKDDVLTGTLSDLRGRATLSGQVSSVSGEPSVDASLALRDVRLDSLSASGDSPLPDLKLSGTLSATGPLEGFSVGGSMIASCDFCRAGLSVDGIVGLGEGGASASLDLRSHDAVVRGVEVPFSARLSADDRRVSLDPIEVAGLGEGRVEILAGDPGALSGSVVVSSAKLRDVVSVLLGSHLPESVGGLVFASVSLSGSAASPVLDGQVQVGNGRALGVEGLSAVLAARLEDDVLHIGEMSLGEMGRQVVRVDGDVDLTGDLALTITGDGVPGPLLGGGVDTRFDVRLGVGGTRSRPTFDGLVEASSGSFLGVSFDEFLARITGAEGVVRVDPLSLEQRGAYRATASGSVPLKALSDDPGSEEIDMTVEVDGDPLAFLADLVPFASEASSEGSMYAFLAGSRRDLTIASARLTASNGTIRPTGLFDKIENVSVNVSIADGLVTEGFVEGSVDGARIRLASARPEDVGVEGLPALTVAGVDVGVLTLSTDDDGVRTYVPSLMLPEDWGRVTVRGKEGAPDLLVAGPPDRPRLWGEITFSDVSFTYPLLDSGGDGGFLSGADWSLRMVAGRNLWYWRPDANLQIVRGGALDFRGVPDDGTLCVSGRVESKRGTVTYANTEFDVREASVDFPLFCEPPRFYVLAETRVEDGTTITLTVDSYEGAFASATPGATFDESELRLSSDSPDDDSREEILSKLQYGVSYELLETGEQASLERRRALEVVGSQLSGKLFRPLLSPVEGRIKRTLHLDLVRFDIDFVQHFIAQLDLWQAQEASSGYQPFLTDTRITLGKYISRNWLLSYVGRAESYEEDIGYSRLGLRQELGIEYEVSRNTSLSMRVVYDPALAGWDRRISIENRFRF